MAGTNASVIAEFVGTFMLVFTVGCNVLSGNQEWGATSIACVLMVCVWALGDVSGANYNPAVSVALGLTKHLEWHMVGYYVGTQIAAGIVAAFAYVAMFGKSFNLSPAHGYGAMEVAVAEFLYTFMLCFVVLNVAVSKKHAKQNEFFGLAIGFVIVAGGYAVGHMGAGCFNPAVAIGIDVSSALHGFGWCLFYSAFELIGAAAAAFLFRVCRPEESEPGRFAPDPRDRELVPRLVSEFLGTFFLVLTVGFNILGGSKAAVWSIAASLMCMIYALGSVSGAHFNPAVTVAVLCALPGKWTNGNEKKTAAAYVGAQLIGGIVAAFIVSAMEHGQTIPIKPSSTYGMFAAWMGEFVFTFVLAFVVLSVTRSPGGLGHHFGLAIGSCVSVGGLAIGGVSGGSLNPAVTTALAFSRLAMTGETMQIVHWICYTLFEILGGATAAAFFVTIRQPTLNYFNDAPKSPRSI